MLSTHMFSLSTIMNENGIKFMLSVENSLRCEMHVG